MLQNDLLFIFTDPYNFSYYFEKEYFQLLRNGWHWEYPHFWSYFPQKIHDETNLIKYKITNGVNPNYHFNKVQDIRWMG